MNDTIRPIDQARACRLVLGLLDDDPTRLNAALVEANTEGTVHLLIAALTNNLLSTMLQVVSEDGVRKTLERTILDAQVADDGV